MSRRLHVAMALAFAVVVVAVGPWSPVAALLLAATLAGCAALVALTADGAQSLARGWSELPEVRAARRGGLRAASAELVGGDRSASGGGRQR